MSKVTMTEHELGHLMVAIIAHATSQVAMAAGNEAEALRAVAQRDRHLDMAGIPPWFDLVQLMASAHADDPS